MFISHIFIFDTHLHGRYQPLPCCDTACQVSLLVYFLPPHLFLKWSSVDIFFSFMEFGPFGCVNTPEAAECYLALLTLHCLRLHEQPPPGAQ